MTNIDLALWSVPVLQIQHLPINPSFYISFIHPSNASSDLFTYPSIYQPNLTCIYRQTLNHPPFTHLTIYSSTNYLSIWNHSSTTYHFTVQPFINLQTFHSLNYPHFIHSLLLYSSYHLGLNDLCILQTILHSFFHLTVHPPFHPSMDPLNQRSPTRGPWTGTGP